MKELWIRLGVVIKITEAEEQAIFGDDEEKMRDALRLIIAEGRFCRTRKPTFPARPCRSSTAPTVRPMRKKTGAVICNAWLGPVFIGSSQLLFYGGRA